MIKNGITRSEVRRLAAHEEGPAISIFLPTFRTGTDVLQGRIRLKNLLVQAEEKLVADGMRRTLALDLLDPAAALVDEPEFWNDRLDAVALFIAPGVFEAYHLPFATPALVAVEEHFHVRPLVRLMNACVGWYVLALDQKAVRLIRCGLSGASDVKVPDMPESLEEFVTFEHPSKQLQYHSAGAAGRSGSLITHGAGDKSADHKDRLQRFALAIEKAVADHLIQSADPIILAGTDEFQDIFRLCAKLPHLLDKGLSGSHKMHDALDLRNLSLPLIQDHSEIGKRSAISHYAAMAGTGLTSQQLEEVVAAAAHGRVDVLFAGDDKPGAENILVNQAVISTLENGGSVYDVSPGEVISAGPVAAIYRY